jgi:4-diphosphocytidyl-2-C-methyl-D-erythritol kinase
VAPFLLMTLRRESPCKVNFLLNILGRRADGFHELESVMFPVPVSDNLEFTRCASGVELTCDHPVLPTDGTNLICRAAAAFFAAAGSAGGVRIRLEKKIPLAAGLGGGSSNAATTLLGLNELFDHPLKPARLAEIAAALGSDVPFFLQSRPALARGRGEQIEPMESFPLLRGAYLLLAHPGFGVSTAWAYAQLTRFPAALNGEPGRARRLIELLRATDFPAAATGFYNSLEAPVIEKFPLLGLVRDFFQANGAVGALMSGSGSTIFALAPDRATADRLTESFRDRFGPGPWLAQVAL